MAGRKFVFMSNGMAALLPVLCFGIGLGISGEPCSLQSLAVAEDWPQWMGPGRDNVWRETGDS